MNILSAANIRKRANFDSVKGRFSGVRGGGTFASKFRILLSLESKEMCFHECYINFVFC